MNTDGEELRLDEEVERFPTGVRGGQRDRGSNAAKSEGWDLYTRDNDELEIEYIAEPHEVPELRDRGIVEPPFNADDDVVPSLPCQGRRETAAFTSSPCTSKAASTTATAGFRTNCLRRRAIPPPT